MKYIKEYSDFEELSKQLKNLHHSLKGMVRNALPEDVYKDYFLELEEVENFRVSLNKGNGFVTSIDINGMIDSYKVESEFNRILRKMNTIKDRLTTIYGFNCHFMIYLNGQGQQENNPVTHKNDIYKFLGVGSGRFGKDRKHSYTDNLTDYDIARGYYKKFPENKVSLNIKFMII